VLVLGLAVLAACAPRTGEWSPAESPKKNVVHWAEFHHPVRFTAVTAEPGRAERDALAQFLDRVGRGQGVRITVASPAGNDARLGLRRETALADFIRDRGFSVTLGQAEPKDGAGSDSVRVTVGRFVSKPPACPDWSKPASGDPTNNVTSNFGCATATNLGLMIADPGVLARGTDLGPADAEATAVGIKDYRLGKEKLPEKTSPLTITGAAQ
jgi:pilus assembly protein CpaD